MKAANLIPLVQMKQLVLLHLVLQPFTLVLMLTSHKTQGLDTTSLKAPLAALDVEKLSMTATGIFQHLPLNGLWENIHLNLSLAM